MSPEPINLQVNILQTPEVARQTSALQQVGAHQKMAQEAHRAKESEKAPETVPIPSEAEEVKLSKDGSGHGHAFLKQPRREVEEQPDEAPEEKHQDDPGKGARIDFTR